MFITGCGTCWYGIAEGTPKLLGGVDVHNIASDTLAMRPGDVQMRPGEMQRTTVAFEKDADVGNGERGGDSEREDIEKAVLLPGSAAATRSERRCTHVSLQPMTGACVAIRSLAEALGAVGDETMVGRGEAPLGCRDAALGRGDATPKLGGGDAIAPKPGDDAR